MKWDVHCVFLAGNLSMGVLAWFLFQLMFMDTAATIPTGSVAKHYRFSAFLLLGFFVSMLLYPVYAHWVWGGGWLAGLGKSCGLGHGYVDYAGSSVVHMTGGFTGLVGAWILGPRIGKYKLNGTPTPCPPTTCPCTCSGTLFLAFGWFGFNTGTSPGRRQSHLHPHCRQYLARLGHRGFCFPGVHAPLVQEAGPELPV